MFFREHVQDCPRKKDRFWLGIMSLIVTIILDMWFLPICTFEIFACIIILMLLTIGYCGEKPLIKTE
ncbi:MAG: hypothetical protein ACTSVY_04625 [Candidatus Helarchaeota archaeon]